MYNCVIINKKDSVATMTYPVKVGEYINGNVDKKALCLKALSDIPIYHKVALVDIKKGEIIYKYGCKIGYALSDIKAGEHVHTFNLDSRMI